MAALRVLCWALIFILHTRVAKLLVSVQFQVKHILYQDLEVKHWTVPCISFQVCLVRNPRVTFCLLDTNVKKSQMKTAAATIYVLLQKC